MFCFATGDLSTEEPREFHSDKKRWSTSLAMDVSSVKVRATSQDIYCEDQLHESGSP